MASPAPPQLEDSRRRYWHDQLGSGDSATASGVTSYAVPVTLGVLLLVGVIGNGSIVYTVCKHRRMKNVPNAFVVNVAVADLLLLFTVSPFVASYYIFDDWLLGGFVCKLTEAMQTFCAAVATLSVTALSIERYCAFASPPRRRRVARRRACVGIVVMWILAAVAALPDAMSALVEHRAAAAGGGGSERTLRRCTTFTEAWGPLYPRIHTIVSACLLFGVPLLLVSVFYMSLGCVVCGKKRRERRRLLARGAGGDGAAPSQQLKPNGALAVNGGGGCGLAESAVDGSPTAGATTTMTRNGSGALLPAYKTGTVSTIARTGTLQSGPGGGGTLARSSDRDRKKDSRTSLLQRQRRSASAMKRRKTMAKVAVLLCFQFAALWAPRYAYRGWFYFAAPTPDEIAGHWAIVHLVGLGAIFLNAALVPFTIISFNRAFRRRLAKYLCCCCSGCGTCCCLDDDEDDANNEEGGRGATQRRRRRRGASCCSPCCADGDSDDDDVDELESDYPMSTATSGYRPTNYLDPYELGIAGDAAVPAAGGVGVPAATGAQVGYDPRYDYGAVGGGGAATAEGLYGTRSLLSDFAYLHRPTMADTVHYAEPALLRYHPLSSGLLHPDQQQQQHLTLQQQQQQQPQHYYVDARYAPGAYHDSLDASPQQQQHMQLQFQQQSPTERRSMAVATAASPVRLGAGEVHGGADTAVSGSQAEPPPPPAMFDSAEDQAAAAAAAEEAVAAAAGAGPAPGVYI